MQSVSLPPLRQWLRHLFEINPVFKRELRARWRRPAAYLTLFFYAVPLAFGMVLFYVDAFERMAITDKSAAELGTVLFESLLMAQLLLWLFIGAIAAAPVIASERERGSLEALQLANLSAWRIVFGKCLSLFSFEALLFLVPLPIVALCFLLGGVEPRTFAGGAFTVALTALCGTSIGLYFSSIRPRPGAALRDVVIFLLAWTAIAALSATQNMGYLSWPLWIRRIFALLELPHPFSALRWMGDESFLWPARDLLPGESPWGFGWPRPVALGGPLFHTIDSQTAWLCSLFILAALSLLFFFLAARGTARTLAEPEVKERLFKRDKRTPKTNAPNLSGGSLPAAIQARRASVLYNEVSLLGGHSFDNPVFGRELRGKLRWRAASRLMWTVRVLLIIVPLGFCGFWLNANLLSRQSYHPFLAMHYLALLNMLLLCLYATVSGATTFTRERDSNTWEGLKLTLLQPRQVLIGKIGPLILVLAVLSLPLGLMLGLNVGEHQITNYYGVPLGSSVFSLRNAVLALAVAFTTPLAIGSIAFFISWLSRTTQVALGLSMAINAAWLLFFVLLASSVTVWDMDGQRFLSWWNPITALQILIQLPAMGNDYLQLLAGLCAVFMLCVATFFMSIVAALMRQKFRDEK